MNNMTFDELIDENVWIEFSDYYSDKGFVELLGLFRYEDVHNNYLNNILDRNNAYNYKLKPMKYFLKLINKKNNKWFSDIKDENDIEYLNVKVRKKLIKHGIPDLFITFKLNNKKYLILLEAKLGSDEHDDQCADYHEEVEKFDEYDEKIYLYLTLDGRKPPSCENDKEKENWYYTITYQDLINDLYEPLKLEESNNLSLTVEEYLKGFNSLYANGFVNDYKDIPITCKGKELTKNLFEFIKKYNICEYDKDNIKKFINKNKDIVKIFLININNINELKSDADSVLKKFPKLESLKAKYCINNEEYKASEYVYNVFKKLIDDEKISLNDDFNYINFAPDGYKYLYTKEEYDKLQKYRYCYSMDYYGELKINNQKYYYAIYSLSEEEIEELISKIKEVFSNYEKVFEIKY